MPALAITPAGEFLPEWLCLDHQDADGTFYTEGACPMSGLAFSHDVCRLTLAADVSANETLILEILFSETQAFRLNLHQPGDPEPFEGANYEWVRDPRLNIWNLDPPGLPPNFIGPITTAPVLEVWRANIVVGKELSAGDEIQIAGCYAARAWKINQPVAFYNYERTTGPGHNHTTQPPLPAGQLRRWTQDQYTATLPTLGLGTWYTERTQHEVILFPVPTDTDYEFPQGTLEIDEPSGVTQTGIQEGYWRHQRQLHSGVYNSMGLEATLASPVVSIIDDTTYRGLGMGWAILRPPTAPDYRHFSGIEQGVLIPPHAPGYEEGFDTYHYGGAISFDVRWYSVLETGSGLDAVQFRTGNVLARAKQVAGIVTVERSFDRGATWPEEASREVTTAAAFDSIPTLMLTPADHCLVWWHDADGAVRAARSVSQGHSWEPHATWSGSGSATGHWAFPRAVYHGGRTLLFIHDGVDVLSVYGSDFGESAGQLLAQFTLPPQLVQARSDRRGYIHTLAVPDLSGPIVYRNTRDGRDWSAPAHLKESASLPGYAVGRGVGFATWQGIGAPDAGGRTDETMGALAAEFTLPDDDFLGDQQFALLADHEDHWYLLAWRSDGTIATWWSRDKGRSWMVPV